MRWRGGRAAGGLNGQGENLSAFGASAAGASTPLGAEAAQLFSLFVNSGQSATDFSGIVRMLDGK